MKARKYTDQQFTDAVKNNFSVRNALQALGLSPTGGSYKLFYVRVKNLNLDISHFTGQSYLKNKSHDWATKIPLTDILVKNSSYLNSNSLRKRLIKEGVLDNKCSRCSITTWQGEKITLHLDHINGDNTDNQLSNLRLLCPNCHSLTPTYCGRNKKSFLEKEIHRCEICDKELSEKRKTNRCIGCREK